MKIDVKVSSQIAKIMGCVPNASIPNWWFGDGSGSPPTAHGIELMSVLLTLATRRATTWMPRYCSDWQVGREGSPNDGSGN